MLTQEDIERAVREWDAPDCGRHLFVSGGTAELDGLRKEALAAMQGQEVT